MGVVEVSLTGEHSLNVVLRLGTHSQLAPPATHKHHTDQSFPTQCSTYNTAATLKQNLRAFNYVMQGSLSTKKSCISTSHVFYSYGMWTNQQLTNQQPME